MENGGSGDWEYQPGDDPDSRFDYSPISSQLGSTYNANLLPGRSALASTR